MGSLYVLMALAGGVLVPLQAGLNMALSARLSHPVWAALVSFAVGMAALALYALRLPNPEWRQVVTEAPPWIWIGGLCGAYLVWMSIFVVPKIGAAVLIACLVGGQMVASVVFDHYGWLGYEVREVNLGRLAGVVFILAGAFLIKKF